MKWPVGICHRSIVIAGFCGWVALSPIVIAADPGANPDTLPMFGQPKIARSDAQKSADESFIRDNTLRFKTRAAASVALAGQGWSALRAKLLDVAMQRFNQAW